MKLLLSMLLLLVMPFAASAYQLTHEIEPDLPLEEYTLTYDCGTTITFETYEEDWTTEDKYHYWVLVYPDNSTVTTCDYTSTFTNAVQLSCTFDLTVGGGSYTIKHYVEIYDTYGNLDTTSYAEKSITVEGTPLNQPSAISGLYRNCSGSDEVYSVSAVSSATGYDWSVPTGWSIEVSSTNYGTFAANVSNSVIIHPPSTGTGTGYIKVRARDNSDVCEDPSIYKGRTIAYGPISTNTISGPTSVGPNSFQQYTLSTTGVSSGTIQWTLPSGAGWTALYGTTSATLDVNVGSSTGIKNLQVSYESCGTTFYDNLDVDVCMSCRVGDRLETDSDLLSVYPNPGKGAMYVESHVIMHELIMFDLQGRPLRTFEPQNKSLQLSLEGIETGVYFLHAIHDGGTAVQRIVIE